MYLTEQITDNSYNDIRELYQLSFGFTQSEEDVRLKYDTKGFGLKNIGLIAKSETNELAAYYGVFPIRLSYFGKDYLVAQSGDTMTAPRHQKKGLFTRLAKETYSLARESGIKLVFGFPNENSYPGLKHKLDWEFYGFMQRFTFNIKTIPFCELSSKFPKLQPFYNSFVKSRIKKYRIQKDQINFEAFNFSNVKGFIKKDIIFFDYKLNRNNVFVVLIDGFQILVKAETHLFIGEVAKIESNQSADLLKSVHKLAKRLACKKVIFTLSQNHWLFDMLKEKSIPIESLPIGFYRIDESLNPEEIQFSNADYDTF